MSIASPMLMNSSFLPIVSKAPRTLAVTSVAPNWLSNCPISLSSSLTRSGKIGAMTSLPDLDQLTPEQLRALAAQLILQVGAMDKKSQHDKTLIEKLTHEIAQLKRFKFTKRSEQMSLEQDSLLDDLIDTDITAIEAELESL